MAVKTTYIVHKQKRHTQAISVTVRKPASLLKRLLHMKYVDTERYTLRPGRGWFGREGLQVTCELAGRLDAALAENLDKVLDEQPIVL